MQRVTFLARCHGFPAALLLSFGALFLGVTNTSAAAKDRGPEAPGINGKWVYLKTEHFEAFSNGGETAGRSLLTDLEQFTWVLSKMAQIEWNPVPVVLIQFKNDAAMTPFKITTMKSREAIAGIFLSLADENIILATTPDATSEARRLLRHEYVHFLTKERWLHQPLWLSEGMAEFYSTFAVRDGKAVMGIPVPQHPRALARRQLPLAQLIAMDRRGYNALGGQDLNTFYAQSWALLHYLLLDRRAGDDAEHLSQYLRLSGDRKLKPEEAMTRAYRSDLATLENEFSAFLRADRYRNLQINLETSMLQPSVTSSPAGAADVAFHLGNALFLQGRGKEAEGYYRLAGKLAKSPVRMHEGLGKLALHDKQHTNALMHLQEAIRLGSQDYLTHFLLARARWEMTPDQAEPNSAFAASAAANILASLDTALRRQPGFTAALHLKSQVCLALNSNLAEGGEALGQALRLEPLRAEFRFTLAEYQLHGKQYADALKTADWLDSRSELLLVMRLAVEDLRSKAKLGLISKPPAN